MQDQRRAVGALDTRDGEAEAVEGSTDIGGIVAGVRQRQRVLVGPVRDYQRHALAGRSRRCEKRWKQRGRASID